MPLVTGYCMVMCENDTSLFCIFLPLLRPFYIFITKKPQNVIDWMFLLLLLRHLSIMKETESMNKYYQHTVTSMCMTMTL